jgi:hypothetical protein
LKPPFPSKILENRRVISVTNRQRCRRDYPSNGDDAVRQGIQTTEDTMSYQVIDSRFANANVAQITKPFAVVAIDRLGFHQIITSFRTRQAAVRACIYLSRKAA